MTYFEIIEGAFLLTILFTGGFYEFVAGLSSIILLSGLVFYFKKEKRWKGHVNDALLLTIGLPVFYLISCIWAVDPGMAIWGIVKYLPVFLFGIGCSILTSDERKKLLNKIPAAGSFMVAASLVFSLLPFLGKRLFVNGRLAGFFLYPNTFAIFLLAGMIILLCTFKERRKDIFCLFFLSMGLVLSASRAVLSLTVPMILLTILLMKKNTEKTLLIKELCAILLPVIVSVIFWAVSGNQSALTHVSSFSVSESTFLGRVLYWKDALPLIIGNPQGLGYLGSYLMQGAIQHGVYSVRSVHNGLLQLMLDVGWIPAILFLIAVFRAWRSKNTLLIQKLVLLVLTLHSLFDMDMDFTCIWMLILLCLDWEELKFHKVTVAKPIYLGLTVIFTGICLWIGSSSLFYYAGNARLSTVLDPGNTLGNMDVLVEEQDMEAQELLAKKILAQNPYVAIAWDVEANTALAAGDLEAYIRNKEKAIEVSRYTTEEYLDYFDSLRYVTGHYLEQGNKENAKYFMGKMQAIPEMLEKVKADTDPLAWKLQDQPVLMLTEEDLNSLMEIEEALK